MSRLPYWRHVLDEHRSLLTSRLTILELMATNALVAINSRILGHSKVPPCDFLTPSVRRQWFPALLIGVYTHNQPVIN